MYDSYYDDMGTEINTHINLNHLLLRLINMKHMSLTKFPRVKHVSKNMPEGHCEKRRFECLHVQLSHILCSHLSLDGR